MTTRMIIWKAAAALCAFVLPFVIITFIISFAKMHFVGIDTWTDEARGFVAAISLSLAFMCACLVGQAS